MVKFDEDALTFLYMTSHAKDLYFNEGVGWQLDCSPQRLPSTALSGFMVYSQVLAGNFTPLVGFCYFFDFCVHIDTWRSSLPCTANNLHPLL